QCSRNSNPEAWPTAAGESRQRLQHVSFAVRLPEFFYRVANHLFCLCRCFVSRLQRRSLRQPDVDVRKILEIFREKLRLELAHQQSAERQEGKRCSHHFPAMIDG